MPKILALILIFSLFSIYIWEVTEITKLSYEENIYQQKIEKLKEENKDLQLDFAQSNSLNNLEILAENLNFEKVDSVHYIRVMEETVASK